MITDNSNLRPYDRFTIFIEHKFLLIFFEKLCWPAFIQEQWVHPLYIFDTDFYTLQAAHLSDKAELID